MRPWRPIVVGMAVICVLVGCGTPAPTVTPLPDDTSAVTGDDRLGRQHAIRLRVVTCDSLTNGSGFLIDPNTVITNAHVVDSWRSGEITTWNGFDVTIDRIWTHTDIDLAVVELIDPVPPDQAVAVTSIADPRVGDPVIVPGYPGGGQFVLRRATVDSQLDGQQLGEYGTVYVITAPIEQGSSGGPVVTTEGALVAVVFGYDPVSGYALALDTSALKRLDVVNGPWVAHEAARCDGEGDDDSTRLDF